MKRASAEPDAIDLLEEAAHLLRAAPLAVHAAYLAGTAPFSLGLLFFVADMSRGAHAAAHEVEASLALAALFVWMKTWQAIAAERALAFLEQRAAVGVRAGAVARLALTQLRLHAWGLFSLPLALLLTLPFAWVVAYFQNVTVLGASAGTELHATCVAQARLWPRQNHFVLGLVAGLSLVVFLNVAVAIYLVPVLVRSLFGIEEVVATIGWNPLNTTLLAAALALTHLVIDPFAKAAYVLRCFYGKAQHTGVDLLVQVRASAPRSAAAVVLVTAVLLVSVGHPLSAAEDQPNPPAAPSAAVSAAELDVALERVLERPEYAWRLPRAQLRADDTANSGVLARFVQSVIRGAKRVFRWIGELVRSLAEWLSRSKSARSDEPDVGGGFVRALHVVLPVATVLLAAALLWLAWRWWRQSHQPAPPAARPVALPSLEREDVTADQLPEDEWLRLARELLARGEVRLALRAFFLGSLAALAARELLVLARHKSNRDYERELEHRGGLAAGAVARFGANRRAFERVWYGRDAIGPDEIRAFEENVRQLRGGAA